MSQTTTDFGPSLQGLSLQDWMEEVSELASYDGHSQRLGKNHFAAFTEHGRTLFVTFETVQGVSALHPKAHPLGWDFVSEFNWSNLALFSDGDTWFRDDAVYAYFDRLVDDGFFENFDDILFFGTGPCGYAAAAFSVVAPGARVLAIQPQATLSPAIAAWDQRFVEERRLDFSSRYGYAPDMLEAARRAYIVFDPKETEDAIHAALYTRPNATKLRVPHLGTCLHSDFLQMGILKDLIRAAQQEDLSTAAFGKLMRARRDHTPYLRRLLAHIDSTGHDARARVLCQNVVARMSAPRFARRLEALDQKAD